MGVGLGANLPCDVICLGSTGSDGRRSGVNEGDWRESGERESGERESLPQQLPSPLLFPDFPTSSTGRRLHVLFHSVVHLILALICYLSN